MKHMTLHNIAAACHGRLVLPGAERTAAETDRGIGNVGSLGSTGNTGDAGSKENAGSMGDTRSMENAGSMGNTDAAGTAAEAGFAAVTMDAEVTGVVLDSRKVEKGNLFLATIGERVDGHRFLPSAWEKGAACVLVSKTPEQVEAEHGIPASAWGAYILVPDVLLALKEIAEYYRSTLTIPVVGITGSVGKTSTKEFIAGVLSEKYRVLKTEGNFNNEVGLPLTILRIREEHQAAVLEMGISDFGEMHRLSKMARPTVCVITNIGQCHLENLGSRDGILKAKTEIFDYMPPEGEVCLNGDDDKLATVTKAVLGSALGGEPVPGNRAASEEQREANGRKVPETQAALRGKPVHFFGLGQNPAEEVYASEIRSKGLFGSEAVLYIGKGAAGSAEREPAIMSAGKSPAIVSDSSELQSFPVELPLPGAHMVINAAAAACVGRLLGLSPEEIAEGIRRVRPVDGRSHLIRLPEYTLIDDCYNANPVSVRAAIELLQIAEMPKAAILGDMFELGEDSAKLHYETGAVAARAGLDTLVLIGENARKMYEGALAVCSSGDAALDVSRLHYFPTKELFLEALHKKGCSAFFPQGSAILIKASHGMKFAELVETLQSWDSTNSGEKIH